MTRITKKEWQFVVECLKVSLPLNSMVAESMDVMASTQSQLGTQIADQHLHNDAADERCIYPNLKLRIYTTGMRQNRLAKRLGMDEGYLSRIVNGIRKPGQELRLQIANVLGCDAEWLFEQGKVETTRNTGRYVTKSV